MGIGEKTRFNRRTCPSLFHPIHRGHRTPLFPINVFPIKAVPNGARRRAAEDYRFKATGRPVGPKEAARVGAKGAAAARQVIQVKRISLEMRTTRKPRSWYPVAVVAVVLTVVLAALAAALEVAAWWQTVS